MMRWTGKLAILALALSIWASPLIACMLPGAVLTLEERECCIAMAGDCGDMDMPASHSCCTTTVQDTGPYLVKACFAGDHSPPAAVLVVPQKITSAASLTLAFPWTLVHSPPVSPPKTISVLRI
ncbi:MAG TPA: hypothetical protein VJA94_05355 [Candidatus Angelobacter sp.]